MITINKLLQRKPQLFDGAMGTSIQGLGLQNVDPPELLNIHYPNELAQIHSNYIKAGAMVIETNTFGGTRSRLKSNNLSEKVEEVNSAAARIAKDIAQDKVYIAGSVGPSGLILEPYGEASIEKVFDIFSEQITILIKSGVDLLLIETMISLDEALVALDAAKKMGSKLTGVTMTFDQGPQGITTSFGDKLSDVCFKLKESGADFIGSNCGHGFDNMKIIAKEMREITDMPILIQPNAGLPIYDNGKVKYKETPEVFGLFTEDLIKIGIDFIGGCCGTTYQHIKAASEKLK
jgi:5-methyltetrahydrofolate--homocysteine methyltransferase